MGSLIDIALNNQHISTIDTSRNVKPDQAKGHLVDTPLYMAPVEYVKDLATDTYGIVKGLNGKANDHELGKQNDVAMKLGGLAIAAYLSTYRLAKLPKLMEFVGLGSFFASMSLWPKLAIALPLKMRTGVDIQQKYVDSYGRKKNFFQDTQYLPWDLYSKDQIKAMGDKMKVPYDVPNRDEVIQEKARKMAVQGNTLWLTTAGFATPILTGLICKGLEPAVETLKQNYDLSRTQKLMAGQNWSAVSNMAPKAQKAAFESFIADNMGKEISSSNQQLLKLLNWSSLKEIELDSVLKKDLAKLLDGANNDITPDYANKIFEKFAKTLGKAGITNEEVSEAFKNSGILGSKEGLIARVKACNPKSEAVSLTEATQEVLKGLLGKKVDSKKAVVLSRKIGNDAIENIVDSLNKKVLDEETAGTLRKVFDQTSSFFKRALSLREWEKAHYTTNADSSVAFAWKKTPNKILSVLNLTQEELDLLGKEGSQTEKLLEQKISKLVADPDKYKKAVTKIADSIAEFDSINNGATREQYRGFVDSLTSAAKKGLKAIGFDSTAEYIGGRELIKDKAGKVINFREAMSGTVNLNRKMAFDETILNTKASMYRFLQLLDMHKRVHDATFEAQFGALKDSSIQVQDVIREAKKLIMNGGTDSHINKLDGKVGEKTYQAVMRLLYGALPEKTVRQETLELTKDLVGNATKFSELPAETQRHFLEVRKAIMKGFDIGTEEGYKAALKHGLNKVKLNELRTGLAQETLEALYESSVKFGKKTGKSIDLVENFKSYTQTFIDKVVNATGNFLDYTLKGGHNVKGAIQDLADSSSPSLTSSLIGSEPTKVIRNAAQELSNNRRWIRKFGIAGAVLLAGTIIATTFFGHIPQKDMYMKDGRK